MPLPLLETPGVYNIRLRQGNTWERLFVARQSASGPVHDLTDHTAAMHVKPTAFSQNPVIELTTENGRITIDGPAGSILLQLTAEETAGLRPLGFVYDLDVYYPPEDRRVTLLTGEFVVDPQVTREEVILL